MVVNRMESYGAESRLGRVFNEFEKKLGEQGYVVAVVWLVNVESRERVLIFDEGMPRELAIAMLQDLKKAAEMAVKRLSQ
jgi:hypothetical protein